MISELRQALRGLRRTPGFTILALVTLSLGIGANAALFSVVRAVLLDPLPYSEPDRTAVLWSSWTGYERTWVSWDEYEIFRETPGIEAVGLFDAVAVDVGVEEPERVRGGLVTSETLEILGARPVAGRLFLPEEGVSGSENVVLLGHELWQRRYGGDPSVVGREIVVSGDAYVVVGVLAPGFRLPLDYGANPATQVYAPYAIDAADYEAIPGPEVARQGGAHAFHAVALLAPGSGVDAVNAQLRARFDALTAAGVYPESWGFRSFAVPVREQIAGGLRTPLMILLAAVGLVLLVACANVAGLLLVRGERRRREVAVRAALGADRPRLIRGLLLEALLLALGGGALGWWVAAAGVEGLLALAPATLPRLGNAAVDGGVLAVTLGLSLATALLFGGLPAWRGSRADPAGTLREGGRGAVGGRVRLRQSLVAGQIAIAVLVGFGAGLMARTMAGLMAVDPGFEAAGVVTGRVSVPSAYYPGDEAVRVFDELGSRMRAIPGVESAGFVRLLPLASDMGDRGLSVEGYAPPPGENTPGEWQIVGPGYFETMRLRLLQGRTLDARDDAGAPLAMVVNRAFADRYLAGRDPIGIQVVVGRGDPYRIVGVVDNVRHAGLDGGVRPRFYATQAQFAVSPGSVIHSLSFVARTSGDPAATLDAIRAAFRAVDPRLPLAEVRTMDEILAASVARPRFTGALLLAFAALAAVLAAIGIFGVVSQVVTARLQEFGLRLALGATPRRLVRHAALSGLAPATAGIGIGALLALAFGRIMDGLVFGVTTTDPVTLAGVAMVTALLATLAAAAPGRRAGRVDAGATLRRE